MKRLFGGSKPYTGPTIEDASNRVGDRAALLDKKIAQLDLELTKIRDQLKRTRSKVQQDALKKRALPMLKQKKMYERQRESLYGQQSNLEQTVFAHNTMKDSIDTVQAMQHAAKTMKKTYKQINIDKVENLQDDLQDLMLDANDLQEVLGRSYDTPDYLDEDDLLEELDSLEGEMLEDEGGSYLDDLNLPNSTPISSRSQQQRVPQNQFKELEDELGLM